jgi:RpiB/LacA/LacB family sugar-phosphate isomerase
MKLAIGADHAGFDMKESVKKHLTELGHEVVDVGTNSADKPDDYPDFAKGVAKQIQGGKVERGVLICGSGVGASVAANKFKGIRAGLCHDHYSAKQGVEHDNMNVLVLGSRVIGSNVATDLVDAYLSANFSGEERHVRRLNKIKSFEDNPS